MGRDGDGVADDGDPTRKTGIVKIMGSGDKETMREREDDGDGGECLCVAEGWTDLCSLDTDAGAKAAAG